MKKICLIIIFIIVSLPLGTAFATYTSSGAFSRMLQLKEQGKIPAYVVEQGTYKYADGISTARVTGTNVFMRSQPRKEARVITKLSNTNLEYLGEWTHPQNSERWVCVKRKGEVGWIYGQYIQLVTATTTSSAQTTPNKNADITTRSDNKSSTNDNFVININWKYVFWGALIIVIINAIIALGGLGEDKYIKVFFRCLFELISIIIVLTVIGFIAYFIIKLVWKKIILPILSGIGVLFLMYLVMANDHIDPNDETHGTPCPYYNRSQCEGCPKLNRFDHKYVDFYTDLHMCNATGHYVDPNKSPYEQSSRLGW